MKTASKTRPRNKRQIVTKAIGAAEFARHSLQSDDDFGIWWLFQLEKSKTFAQLIESRNLMNPVNLYNRIGDEDRTIFRHLCAFIDNLIF